MNLNFSHQVILYEFLRAAAKTPPFYGETAMLF